MDQLRVYSKILLILMTLSQVRGNPMFYWSQQEPDCSQQNNNDNSYQNYQQNSYQGYQAPTYQSSGYQGSSYQDPSYQGSGYQGPSYQETLQTMLADTLKALCDIIQSTVQASKQEIATVARVFLHKTTYSNNCESDETPDQEYNVQPIGMVDNNPAGPQSVPTTWMEISTSTAKPDLLSQNNNESIVSTNSEEHNSTSLVSSTLKAELNTTLSSTSTTKPTISTTKTSITTTEKTNSDIAPGTDSATGAQSSNKTMSEESTLKS